MQCDHSPGKPGKVREFQSGQGKVRENICLYFAKYRQKTEHKNREHDTPADTRRGRSRLLILLHTVRYRQIKTYHHKTTALKLETEMTAAIC